MKTTLADPGDLRSPIKELSKLLYMLLHKNTQRLTETCETNRLQKFTYKSWTGPTYEKCEKVEKPKATTIEARECDKGIHLGIDTK